MQTVLIEREHLGGTCVNDGCIPTKTLVASARAAHVARRAADYGVCVGGNVGVDMKAVKARKDRVVAHSVEGLEQVARGTANLSSSGATRASSGRTRSRSTGARLEAPQDLHQRRRARGAAELARPRRRAGADQHVDDGDRHRCRRT